MTNTLPGMELPSEARSLSELASALRHDHKHFERAARETLRYMQMMGELLSEAKGLVGHGMFLPWVKRNCPFVMRSAQRYIRAWQERGKCDTVSHLDDRLETATRPFKETQTHDDPEDAGGDGGGVAEEGVVDSGSQAGSVTADDSGGTGDDSGGQAGGETTAKGSGSTGAGKGAAPADSEPPQELSHFNKRFDRLLRDLNAFFEDFRLWLAARGHVDDTIGHGWIRLGGHLIEELQKVYAHSRSVDAKDGGRLVCVALDAGKAIRVACARLRDLVGNYCDTDRGRHLTELAGRADWLAEVEAKLEEAEG